jgi:hydrogenase-4 component E
MILRGAIFPKLLVSELRGEQAAERESRPLVNTSASLLITAVLVIVAYVTSEPMIAINRTPSTQAVPIGMAMALIAVFLLITRRKAISQVIALLMLDNGIDAVAFLATPGVPLIVELGASLDVLFALIILGVLAGRMYTEFASGDLDELRALREK